jgi:hypothetical protein
MRKLFAVAGAAFVLAAASAASASVTGVTTVGALSPNATIDWSQLGGQFTSVPSSVNVLDSLGNTVNVTSGGGMLRLDEGSGWAGNFSSGEPLLWTDQNGPDITLHFTNAVFGVGAQIQADFYGAFTAEVFTSDGSFSENGVSNGNNDGSAIFIGMTSTAPITAFTFHLTNAVLAPNDFAIGHVSLNTTGGSATPEPAAWALMIAGFGLAGASLRRRHRAIA